VEARARRQVPALGVPGVDGLAVAARVVRHAIRWRRCALQPVLVQAALRARRGMPDVLVADAELEVPHVVCGDEDLELDDLPGDQRRPRAGGEPQEIGFFAPLAAVPANAVPVAALRATGEGFGDASAPAQRWEVDVAMPRGEANGGPPTQGREERWHPHGHLEAA